MEVADHHLSLRQELSTPFPTHLQEVVVDEEVLLLREEATKVPQEEAGPSTPRLPRYSSMYLAKPFSIPNLDVVDDSPWRARKFLFHLTKPLCSKEMAAPYADLVDPYATYAPIAKYFNQAINGAFVLARRADLLAVDNNSLHYKNSPHRGEWPRLTLLKKRDWTPKGTHGDERKIVGWRRRHNSQPKDTLRGGRGKEEEIAQIKRDANLGLASAAAKAEFDRINFANSTLRSFLSSLAYEKKMGSECAAYYHSVMASTSRRFPDLLAVFKEDMIRRPDWYRA
ncbi:hypothetical protein LIER_23581 [Lithospermum erythrorhizon]|uniref:Uncharacterized protein n=1 Tax=Lithospermum erythrorhizon TaxID=34254 RepID=A0AAV3QY38_LITER